MLTIHGIIFKKKNHKVSFDVIDVVSVKIHFKMIQRDTFVYYGILFVSNGI